MTKQILVILSILGSFAFTVQASAAITASPKKVCRQLLRVKLPKDISPDECYSQAKEYLKSKDIKVMVGSYQAYFALSDGDKTQNNCRPFLREMVLATQMIELEDAKDIFGDDKAFSLDRSYYSFATCMDMKEEIVAEQKKAAKLAKAKAKKSAPQTQQAPTPQFRQSSIPFVQGAK